MAVDNHCEWSESWRINRTHTTSTFQLVLSAARITITNRFDRWHLKKWKCIVHFLSTLLRLVNGQWPTPLPDLDGAKALNNKNNWHSLSIDVKVVKAKKLSIDIRRIFIKWIVFL